MASERENSLIAQGLSTVVSTVGAAEAMCGPLSVVGEALSSGATQHMLLRELLLEDSISGLISGEEFDEWVERAGTPNPAKVTQELKEYNEFRKRKLLNQ